MLILNKNLRLDRDFKNVSLVILNYQTSNLTIKLISSIFEFETTWQGEIILVDNGSNEDEKLLLHNYIQTLNYSNLYLVELKENIGIGPARNVGIKKSTKDFIFFLDNDIFIKNVFIEKLRESQLKSRSLILNLMLTRPDSNLYSGPANLALVARKSQSVVEIEISQIFDNLSEVVDCFSDFIYGGASIIHKDIFVSLGLFDYRMKIGFEDIDFSIRVLEAGYKVYNSGHNFLVHDHANPEKIKVKEVRLNSATLKKSSDILYRKYGVRPFGEGTKDWLKNKLNEKF